MSNSLFLTGRGPQRDVPKAEFWRQALRDFASSGQSVRAFCRARGVSEPSFYAWRRTLERRNAAKAAAPAGRRDETAALAPPAFLPLRLADSGGRMEIVLAGRRRIRLRGPVDRLALIEVLAALEAATRREA